jgi:hypothetical protein
MEEKAVLIGAAAAVALPGRGLRSEVKVVMRGVVAAGEATAGARRKLEQLYAEAKEEHGGPSGGGGGGAGAQGRETAPGTSGSASA